jgi:hypothetical protein
MNTLVTLMTTMNMHNLLLMLLWQQCQKMMNTVLFAEELLHIKRLKTESYHQWGLAFANYSQIEFECIVQLQVKSTYEKNVDNNLGQKP